jgi:phosphoribosylformimino-5-aminoimidazole carboxamide ribotide isomerase
MHLFPAIDLMDGKVVRLYQGDYDQQTTYGDDPSAQAKAFEDAGATWLHVVDLAGARSGAGEHVAVVEAICRATSLKVEIGGGIRDRPAIDRYLSSGVERVILGTAALENWSGFEQWAQDPALHNKLVLGLDARKGRLAVSGWETQVEATALEVAQSVKGWPLAAIVYTDIETDGTLKGPNVETTQQMAEATDVPIVASGGVGTLAHLETLRCLPVQGAIVGRALYDGAFTIDQALAVLEKGESAL